MADPLIDLAIDNILNASASVDLPGQSRADNIRGASLKLVQFVTGTCKKSGQTPVDGTTCECVPCRAWRAEKAEGRVKGLEAAVAKGEKRVAVLDQKLDQLTDALASSRATIEDLTEQLTAERLAHEETGEHLAKADATVARQADAISVLNDKLDGAARVIARQQDELDRLAKIESKTQAFVLSFNHVTEEV